MTEPITENRSQGRTHLFVVATLSWSNGCLSVRMRNVSPYGAMVEMTGGPSVGDRVKLRRNELSATGTVVWRMGNRLGMKFERPIVPENWLPATQKRQQQIDATVDQLRASPPQVRNLSQLPLQTSRVRAEELAGIADMLDALADSFSADPDVLARYSNQLQVLDVASQNLRKISQ